MQIKDLMDIIRLPFRKEKELYLSLYDIIGFYPRNIRYYQQALMHKSIGHREKGKPVNNERLEFRQTMEGKDKSGSPKFGYQAVLEGNVLGERGEGYSKKEAQQMAAKLTLQRLRKEPQFIDRVFGAKTDRTKMEEMPTMAVPDTEEPQMDFIQDSAPHPMPQPKAKTKKAVKAERLERFDGTDPQQTEKQEQEAEKPRKAKKTVMEEVDELHLDDIKTGTLSREEIIAAAEAAAFEAGE